MHVALVYRGNEETAQQFLAQQDEILKSTAAFLYGNETTSVSALAQRLKGFTHPVQGTLWFRYNGEILNELRDRLGK